MSSSGTDELKTVEADVKAFIQNAEADLIAIGEKAYAWLEAELKALAPTVLADLKIAVEVAVTAALSGGSTPGTIVADVLTILARDGADVLAQVKSDVVTAVVGLTGARPSDGSTG